MTKIENFKVKNNKILDLSDIKNIPLLSTLEQKNLAILVLARNELSRLKDFDRDTFSNLLLDYLVANVPDFNELDSLFTKYFEETNPILRNIIFKKIKPLEPLAVYLSEMAVVFNKTYKTSELTIKGFVYNLILDWFEGEKKQSTYLLEANNLKLQPEIDKLIKRTKDDKEAREKLNEAFDNAIEISEFLRDFKFKILVPMKCVKGRVKKRK